MERIAGDTTALEAWSGVLTRARAELQDTTIVMWFADVVPVSLEEEVLPSVEDLRQQVTTLLKY